MSTHTADPVRDGSDRARRSNNGSDRDDSGTARTETTVAREAAEREEARDSTAGSDRDGRPASRAARLQRTRGNRAVARAVNAARERHGGALSTESRRQDSTRGSEGGASGDGSSSAASSAASRTTVGNGDPLPADTRKAFESRLGWSLEGVRLHTGPQAASVADGHDASAVTSGRNVYFNEGAYRPHSSVGRGLLTHELTHAAQQPLGSGTDAGSADAVSRDHPMEREASSVTRRIAAGRSVDGVRPHASGTPMAARQAADEQAPPVMTGPFGSEVGPPAPGVGEREGGTAAGPPLDLQGSGTVDAAAVERRLPGEATEGTIPVAFGSLAQGEMRVKKRPSGEYGTPANQTLAFSHPGLAPLAEHDVSPALVVDLTDGTLRGFVSLEGGRRDVMHKGALFDWIANNPALMGWAGLGDLKMPGFENGIEGGQLVTKVDGFAFTLGGFMNGTGSFGLVGEAVVFDAEAEVDVNGLEKGTLALHRTLEGTLSGSADVAVAFDTFSGTVHAEYGNGTVAMEGTAAYVGEKFDGSVTLLVTHRDRAENLARERLDSDAVREAAEEAGGEEVTGIEEPEAGPRPGSRAVAGYGTINVNLTEWLAGSAEVIVDGKGDVTVVGEVAPPAEVTLFEQRDYVHELPRIEVRAIYGVPIVGNLNVFANVGVATLAKLGPGTLYDITLEGTYSTDPQVYQNYSLAASLNISAFAGIRIRAEGGVGVTIAAHDLKAGVGIESIAGIRGYVDARPTIGYRERADPKQGKTGQFYIAGHMQIAARPSVALGGDMFVELDSPWYSPAPDRKWTWPLGELEYPLPGEFGIGADLDYVLGSGAVPDVEFGEVAFDSERFMTDLMNDHVPKGGAGEVEAEGTFEDRGEATNRPTVESADSEGTGSVDRPPEQRGEAGGASPEPAQGRQRDDEGEPPAPGVEREWQGAMTALMDLRQCARRDPLTREELDFELARIRRQYRFSTFRVDRSGSDWVVTVGMSPGTTFRFEAEPEGPIAGEQSVYEVTVERLQNVRQMEVRASEAGVHPRMLDELRRRYGYDPDQHLRVLESEIERQRSIGRAEEAHEPVSESTLAERQRTREERRLSGAGSPEEGQQYGKLTELRAKRELQSLFGASNVDEQVQIYPHGHDGRPKDFYFVPDYVVKVGGEYHVYDVKLLKETPLTSNQRRGYPLLVANGGTVRSKRTRLFEQTDTISPVTAAKKITLPEDPRKSDVPFDLWTLVYESI